MVKKTRVSMIETLGLSEKEWDALHKEFGHKKVDSENVSDLLQSLIKGFETKEIPLFCQGYLFGRFVARNERAGKRTLED